MDAEFGSEVTKRANSGNKAPRSMPTWFEDVGSDSDILVAIDPNPEEFIAQDNEDAQRKVNNYVNVAEDGEIGIAR